MRYSEIINITLEQTLVEAFDIQEAGINAERQENGFVKSIADAIANNGGKPIKLIAGQTTIDGVTGAEKYMGRQESVLNHILILYLTQIKVILIFR